MIDLCESFVFIDPGNVKNIAEVFVNGKSKGTSWKMPLTMEISKGLKSVENIIEVKVNNLWFNRLFGDQHQAW